MLSINSRNKKGKHIKEHSPWAIGLFWPLSNSFKVDGMREATLDPDRARGSCSLLASGCFLGCLAVATCSCHHLRVR